MKTHWTYPSLEECLKDIANMETKEDQNNCKATITCLRTETERSLAKAAFITKKYRVIK